MPETITRCCLATLIPVSTLLLVPGARAQSTNAPPGTTQPTDADAMPAADPDAIYKDVRIKGYDIPLAAPSDTIEGDLGGFRRKLASAGLGWFGYTPTNFLDNVYPHNRSTTQTYSGQHVTVSWGTPFILAYDLGRLGLGDAQLAVGLQLFATTWKPSGPPGASLSTLTLYKSFWRKRLELKAGYMANGFEFYNPYIAGNFAAGVFGTSASIPAEVGMSTTSYTKPGANMKINLGHFYDKAGIQAAISPDGTVAEKDANPTGFKWHVAHAGTFYINEVGYRHDAAVGHKQVWLRAAILKSTSAYTNALTTDRIHGQWGAYVLGDRQLTQIGHTKASAYRGLYAGFSAMYAPPRINRFSQYYEARLYGIGLIPSRPHDMMSLIFDENVFGKDYVDVARLGGSLAHGSAKTTTISYTARLLRGLTMGFGVGYTDHPTPITYTADTGHAVTLISNLVITY